MKYKWCSEIKQYNYKSKVILANTVNGKWVRISKELADNIEKMICEDISIDQIEFENQNDKVFFHELLNSLSDLEIINDVNKDEVLQNKIASVELTERCNLKCIHCCMNAQNNILSTVDMSYEKMIQVLDKIIDWNPKSMMLSGGEPMLRRDFFALAEYIREKYRGHVILSTNGLLINEKNVELD